MESRFDQERRWLTEMERLGPEAVRTLLRDRKPITAQEPYPEDHFVEAWLRRKARRVHLQVVALILLILIITAIAAWFAIRT